MSNPERKPYALDVGCGVGSSSGFYALNKEAVRVGIDVNERLVKEISEKEPQSHFVVAEAEHLPFTDQAFEKVYCTHVLEHLKRPLDTVGETHRVLESKGQLVVSTPHPLYEKVNQKITPALHVAVEHHKVFTATTLKRLLKDNGFEVTKISKRFGIATIKNSLLFLINRFFYKREIESQTGRLIFEHGEISKTKRKWRRFLQKLSRDLDTLIFISENKTAALKRYRLLAPLRWFNHLCPWEIYAEAEKK